MELGMVGLGKMGGNMVRRLLRAGHGLVASDRSQTSVEQLVSEGSRGAQSLDELVSKLARPRAVWVMVPSGDPTEQVVQALGALLDPNDIVIDGGNSYFKDDIRRARDLSLHDIHYVDVGTSGGVWGLERGYCLMIGGVSEAVSRLDPVFRTLAPGRGQIERTPGRVQKAGTSEDGYLHCGPVGAGHFVKMIHNGIEYGLMQAYAEGFDLLRSAAGADVPNERRYQLDLADIAEVWRRGSVIGSWLLDLTAMALLEEPDLARYSGLVHDSGEGRWTIQTAVEHGVPATVLSAALYTRFRSRQDHAFSEKVLSAMREKFGGHTERPTGG